MTTNAAPVFDAALALPLPLRADLAAKLIESLESPPSSSDAADGWAEVIESRSDELHRGDAELVEGDEALAIIQAAIDRAAASK